MHLNKWSSWGDFGAKTWTNVPRGDGVSETTDFCYSQRYLSAFKIFSSLLIDVSGVHILLQSCFFFLLVFVFLFKLENSIVNLFISPETIGIYDLKLSRCKLLIAGVAV